MLTIIVPPFDAWDNEKQEFVPLKPSQTLHLEHSLVSIKKWESKWHKPFLSKDPLTNVELLDYIRCMTITQNVSDEVYSRLSVNNIKEIQAYMDDPHTATWFGTKGGPKKTTGFGGGRVVTAELIYYWMISYSIPVEFQKWHLNELMTLIKIFNEENKPKGKQKVNQSEAAIERARLNAERKAAMHTSG